MSNESGDAMRILAIDIETQPNLAYVWGLWDQNVGLNQLVESGQMMCWVAKWIGEPDIEFRSIHHDGQEHMIRRAWVLLNQADVVLHFNGRKFDVPHLNREFLRFNLTPPSPYKQVDLLSVAKKEFRFPSNKLAYISKALGLQGKVDHEGFDLWIKCMAGDEAAWERMRTYNVRDVTLLEDLYAKLRPWIRSHPSMAAHHGEDVCPKCASKRLERRGFAVLRTGKYQRFQCRDCGSWARATKRCDHTEMVEVPNS